MASSQQDSSRQRRAISGGFWFWTGFWLIIAALAGFYFYATYQLRNKIVVANDGDVKIDRRHAEEWAQKLPQLKRAIDLIGTDAREEVQSQIDQQIDTVFQPVYGQIPKFADFHYSVKGEYTELLAAATGKAAEKLGEVLFEQIDYGARLDAALGQLKSESDSVIVSALDSIREKMRQEMQFSPQDIDQLNVAAKLDIDEVKQQLELEFRGVRAAASAATAVVAGKLVAKKLGQKVVAKAAAKGLLKAGGKAGTSAASGGLAALLCVAGGPVTMAACGIVVGGVVWFGTDKAMVELDEFFNREEFEEDLKKLVDEQKENLKQSLQRKYDELFIKLAEQKKSDFDNLTPLDMMRKRK